MTVLGTIATKKRTFLSKTAPANFLAVRTDPELVVAVNMTNTRFTMFTGLPYVKAIRERKQLDRLIDQLREGDSVVVTKYDRLARSLRDLMDLVETIRCRGADFRSLAENIDTNNPSGRLKRRA